MTAPSKPWEESRVLNSSAPAQHLGMNRGRAFAAGAAPPLPPRLYRPPVASPMNSIYGSFGRPAYGYGYQGYGMGYGTGYGSGYGTSMYGPETRFIQFAEESTRPAFQGIESLVRTFGSLAMMLDSTYFTLTNSFRAMLSMAENLARMRSVFRQLFSSFAVFRFVNWFVQRALQFLGVAAPASDEDSVWSELLHKQNNSATTQQPTSSNWPLLIFLGLIVSAPYMVAKLIPSPIVDPHDSKTWSASGIKAKALYRFVPSCNNELAMSVGDQVLIAPNNVQQQMQLANTGWVLATSNRGGTGIIPLNYVQVVQAPPQELLPTAAGVDDSHQLPEQDALETQTGR